MRQKAKLFNKFLQSYLISLLIKKFEFIFQEIFLSKTIQKYIDDPYCGFALTAWSLTKENDRHEKQQSKT